jgi:hypothetical protein
MNRYKTTPKHPIAILLWRLACIVHHSDSILATMVANPGHHFSKMLTLYDPKLVLRDLRSLLVTMEPIPDVMAMPTGIPLHVELALQLKEIPHNVKKVLSSLREQTTRIIVKVVKTATDCEKFSPLSRTNQWML